MITKARSLAHHQDSVKISCIEVLLAFPNGDGLTVIRLEIEAHPRFYFEQNGDLIVGLCYDWTLPAEDKAHDGEEIPYVPRCDYEAFICRECDRFHDQPFEYTLREAHMSLGYGNAAEYALFTLLDAERESNSLLLGQDFLLQLVELVMSHSDWRGPVASC